jgi:outer membrane protein TolC
LSFDRAIELALRQAPSLQAEIARQEAANHAAGPAASLPDPKLILGVDNVPIEGDERFSLDSERMTMQRIGISQQFPNGAKRQARDMAAQSQLSLATAQTQVTRLQVLREVSSAWIARHTIEQQLAKMEALKRENSLFDQAVKAMVVGGEARASDVISPKQEAAEIDALQDNLLAKHQLAVASLARWIGEAARKPLAGAAPLWPISADISLHSLEHHPELEVADRKVDFLSAQVREADAAKRPDWGVTVAYLKRGDDFSDMATLQFNMDLPLFGGSRQGPRASAARAERVAVEAERDALRREHEAMLVADLAEYHRLEKALQRQRNVMLPLASEKVELLTAAWRGNKATLAEVVAARRAKITEQIKEIEMAGAFHQRAARLHYTYEHESGTHIEGAKP